MYHRWVWPLVASVTAIIIIALDGFIEQAAERVYFLIGVFGMAIIAFGCLVSWRYRPMLTSPQEGTHASPGEGPMHVSLTVRGETAAKPQGKAAKEAFDVRMWEAYQFVCSVLTTTIHEPGSVPKLLAERELMLAKFQHIEFENSQLREQVERLLPELTRAVRKAGSVIRASKPAPAAKARDPRVPKVGTILRATHKGVNYEAKVVAAGIEFRGAVHGSVSKVGRLITGKACNGYVLFKLNE